MLEYEAVMSDDEKTKKEGCGTMLFKYFLRFALVAFIGFVALLCIAFCSVMKGGTRGEDGEARDPFNRFLDIQERSLDMSEKMMKEVDKELEEAHKGVEEADKRAAEMEKEK